MIRVFITLYCLVIFSGQLLAQKPASTVRDNELFKVVPVIMGDIDVYLKEEELYVDDVEGYVKRGFDKLRDSHYEEAILDFDHAIESYPEAAVAFYYRGIAKKELDMLQDAKSDFNRAIKLDNLLLDARLELGLVETKLGNKIYARNQFEIVKKALPDSPLPWFYLGNMALEEQLNKRRYDYYDNQVSDIKSNFKKALQLDQEFTPAYLQLGMLNVYLHKTKEARKYYRQAIAIDSLLAEAYLGVGYSYLMDDRLDKSLASWAKLSQLYPEEPAFLALMGHLHNELKDYNTAIDYYIKYAQESNFTRKSYVVKEAQLNEMVDFHNVIRLYEPRRQSFAGKQREDMDEGLSLLIAKDFKGAIKPLAKAIKFNPENTLAHYYRGMAYGSLANLPKAIQDYDIAILLDNSIYDLYKKRGLSRYYTDNPIGAIRDFNKMLLLNPTDVNVYRYRGMAKMKAENYLGAVLDYQVFLEHDSTDINVFMERGQCFEAMADYEMAIKEYEYAISLGGYSALNRLTKCMASIAAIKLDQGDTVEALAAAKRIFTLDINNDNAHNFRAMIFIEQHDYDSALYELGEAINFGVIQLNSVMIRARLFLVQENYSAALDDLNWVIKSKVFSGEAYYYRAVVKKLMRDQSGAIDDFNKSVEMGFVPEFWDMPFPQPYFK